MKTKRNKHGKIFFLMLSVTLLLLAAFSVGMTLGKFTMEVDPEIVFEIDDGTRVTIDASMAGDPESPDRPGIEEEAPASVYQVQPGDTLASVAEKFHVSVDALAAYNNLDPAADLAPGTI